MKTSGRSATLRLAAALVLVPAALWSVHWWRHDRQRRDVPVPAANATPVQVAEACVAASDAHDRATLSVLGGCCLDGAGSVHLSSAPRESSPERPGEAHVGINVTLDGRPFGSGLDLRRGGPAGWRISSCGQG